MKVFKWNLFFYTRKKIVSFQTNVLKKILLLKYSRHHFVIRRRHGSPEWRELYYLQWCRSWFEDPHDMWCTFSCMDISYVCPINNANIWPFFGLLRDASALASIKTPNIILEKMTGPNIADKKGDSGAEGVISGFKFLNIGQETWYSIK